MEEVVSIDQGALWSPTSKAIRQTSMYALMQRINRQFSMSLQSYDDLHHWSISHLSEFWQVCADFCQINFQQPASQVLIEAENIYDTQWFKSAQLNYAENLLSYANSSATEGDKAALIYCDEMGQRLEISYNELVSRVAQTASALTNEGVVAGDRVAGYLPNVIESVVAMLATTSLGAVWSSCSADFGVEGVVDRLGQIEPKVLFAADGYAYAGKQHDCRDKILTVIESLPSLKKVVIASYLSHEGEQNKVVINGVTFKQAPPSSLKDKVVSFDCFLDTQANTIQFAPCNFHDPLFILFSSGTTGKPKCIVHSVGGTILQHKKELVLHTNLSSHDTIFYYTTCGWMMWNWLVSSLSVGASVVLYEGSPMHPDPSILWEVAERERVSVFGTSANYLSYLQKYNYHPNQNMDLSALKSLLSTGSPLTHESYDYVYQSIKSDLCLSSISGGTDIISCFALGCPMKPVYRGELQCLGLGMSVAVFDGNGSPVQQEKGELVCTQSFPSMPIGFWQDDGRKRFKQAYFERFDKVWAHGDYAEITAQKGLIIYGRADAVLNPGGVRIGTAEIYRQVDSVQEVLESVCIGQEWKGDSRVILFVRLRENVDLSKDLISMIKKTIRQKTSPRHVPAKIIAVGDIPKTISGKVVELAVTDVVHGRDVKNMTALKNPESLALFRDLLELQQD